MDKDNGRENNEIRFGDNRNIKKDEFTVTEVGDLSGACSDGNWDPERDNRRDRDRRDRDRTDRDRDQDELCECNSDNRCCRRHCHNDDDGDDSRMMCQLFRSLRVKSTPTFRGDPKEEELRNRQWCLYLAMSLHAMSSDTLQVTVRICQMKNRTPIGL